MITIVSDFKPQNGMIQNVSIRSLSATHWANAAIVEDSAPSK